MSAELPTVVCVDGDDETRSSTVEALETAGFEVRPTASVAGVETAIDDSVGCVVTTTTLPDGDGFDVVELVRDSFPDCACVLFTDEPPADLPRGGRDQVVEYVPRSVPEASERLVEVVRAAATGVTQAA